MGRGAQAGGQVGGGDRKGRRAVGQAGCSAEQASQAHMVRLRLPLLGRRRAGQGVGLSR